MKSCVLDKNQNNIKVGDWVWYSRWNFKTRIYVFDADRITGVGITTIYVEKYQGALWSANVEKLPSYRKQREQAIFLKKLEE